MKISKISLFATALIILLSIFMPTNYSQAKNIEEMRDLLFKIINCDEKLNKLDKEFSELEKEYNRRLQEGDGYKEVKIKMENLVREIIHLNEQARKLRRELAELEKKIGYQEGHGYIEVKVNREIFSRPSKNLLRWDWQLRFDEISGVGVTLTKCWERGYRGSKEKVNRQISINLRIDKFGSAFLDTPFMQYSTNYDKRSPGTMKFIYSGFDDNGNKVKTELLEITKYPVK